MSAQHKKVESGESEHLAPGAEAGETPEEVAGYIADMVLQLRNMAKDNQLEFLAYLLEMSFQEAFDVSQKKKA